MRRRRRMGRCRLRPRLRESNSDLGGRIDLTAAGRAGKPPQVIVLPRRLTECGKSRQERISGTYRMFPQRAYVGNERLRAAETWRQSPKFAPAGLVPGP